jgi:FlaA1/EpsC-like NDP-sugar epimerase
LSNFNGITIPITEALKSLKHSTDNVVLFGAGFEGLCTLRYLECRSIPVRYFCDNAKSKHGKYIENIEIISPERLLALMRETRITVIITSSSYYAEIKEQLNGISVYTLN